MMSFGGIFRLLLIVIAWSQLTSCGVAKQASPTIITKKPFVIKYDKLSSSEIDSLKAIYGNNKKIDDDYESQILIALSRFPELKNVHIDFKEIGGIKTTMAAYPKPIATIFGVRRYKVAIGGDRSRIPLERASFNAQVGVIAHELSHIVDYENKNFFGLVGVATKYISRARRRFYEHQIDNATIVRGFGWQLYEWAQFSLGNESGAPERYKEYKRDVYMTAEEILAFIKYFSGYKLTLEEDLQKQGNSQNPVL